MKTWVSMLLTLILLLMTALPASAVGSPRSDPPLGTPTHIGTHTASAVVPSWALTLTDIDTGKRIVDLSAMRTTTATPSGSTTSIDRSPTDTVVQVLFVLLMLSALMNIYLWRRVNERKPREPPHNPSYDDFPPEGWM